MTHPEKQTGPRLPIGTIFLVALLVLPFLELAVLIKVGGWLGVLPTIALLILTGIIGTWTVRQQGFGVLLRAQRQLEQGVPPLAEVFEGFCLVLAGLLLLLPGFITDVLGLLLLLPFVRHGLYRLIGGRLNVRTTTVRRDQVLEGQYEEVDERAPAGPPPALEHEPDDGAPPPRGSWDRRP